MYLHIYQYQGKKAKCSIENNSLTIRNKSFSELLVSTAVLKYMETVRLLQ